MIEGSRPWPERSDQSCLISINNPIHPTNITWFRLRHMHVRWVKSYKVLWNMGKVLWNPMILLFCVGLESKIDNFITLEIGEIIWKSYKMPWFDLFLCVFKLNPIFLVHVEVSSKGLTISDVRLIKKARRRREFTTLRNVTFLSCYDGDTCFSTLPEVVEHVPELAPLFGCEYF